ncbi:B3 domain-containing transcription factor FUS3-like [Olea europaea var. sylvestris]|uniref:B3 domain-containing transcription factor FUS3-like n=1 Tax=Olea europaea subsp. europaea TaxID=158383 RepID=A0A8S0TQP4_OLEEU|nr:B3 domain-containing transcription factor FUS3-like [Olea europaea var. sylvestris]CAA3005698.1 B3 domain-containing transcription factor FUS3-like [Olea europaea subsp. europaea]
MEISKHKTGPGERRRRSRLHQVKQSASLSQNTTELTQNQDLFSGPAFNIRRKPRMGSRVKRIGLECLKISSAHMPSAFAAREIDPDTLEYLFGKVLKKSDVGSLRRMIIPKKSAENYLPDLEFKDGIQISMYDMDGIHEWGFKFRFWPNNSSRMYVLENTGDFVSTHGLHAGDSIAVYRCMESGKLVIEARRVGDLYVGDDQENAEKDKPITDRIPTFDEIEMILSYDIPFAFHDDPALDFLGQPAQDYSKVEPVQMMMENSKIESMAGMESIDNFSIDEWINI